MDVRLLFPNDYIKCADLRGNDVALTIADVRVEELRTTSGTEQKAVMTFHELDSRPEGTPRKFVLNKTNAMQIAKVLGENETDQWRGKRITLHGTTCQAFGDMVDCIRVRNTAPPAKANGAQAEPAPNYNEPGPFDGVAP